MRIDGFTPLRKRGNRLETFLVLSHSRVDTTISIAKARDLADAIYHILELEK